jgi:NAD-dependent dihydropyrimidine dehydrogenase PreA subunit
MAQAYAGAVDPPSELRSAGIEVTEVSTDGTKASILVSGEGAVAKADAVRRCLMTSIRNMAIAYVRVKENTTLYPDAQIAFPLFHLPVHVDEEDLAKFIPNEICGHPNSGEQPSRADIIKANSRIDPRDHVFTKHEALPAACPDCAVLFTLNTTKLRGENPDPDDEFVVHSGHLERVMTKNGPSEENAYIYEPRLPSTEVLAERVKRAMEHHTLGDAPEEDAELHPRHIPIVTLRGKQNITLEALAILGTGKRNARWNKLLVKCVSVPRVRIIPERVKKEWDMPRRRTIVRSCPQDVFALNEVGDIEVANESACSKCLGCVSLAREWRRTKEEGEEWTFDEHELSPTFATPDPGAHEIDALPVTVKDEDEQRSITVETLNGTSALNKIAEAYAVLSQTTWHMKGALSLKTGPSM